MGYTSDMTIITLDGNIGVGKSTLLTQIGERMPEVEIVLEPVGVWESLVSEEGKSLLTHFYEDPKRWGYSFQNCAILTRILAVRDAVSVTKKRVIITERSVLTDLNVFAKMNRDLGNINSLEWDLYMKWVDGYSHETPVHAVIHVTTSVDTAVRRISERARDGEGSIPRDYLQKLDEYHSDWLGHTDLPVLSISTEDGEDVDANVAKVRTFIDEVIG
jgi:deoxyadenosine/deoxycytidine kinase